MKTYASRPKPETAIRKYRPRGTVQVPKLSSVWNELLSARPAKARLMNARCFSSIVSNVCDPIVPVAASTSSASPERNR